MGVTPAMMQGAGCSLGGMASGAVASFVVQVILARALEATRYGVYSYLLAWVNAAVLVGKLEFDTAAIRFIATYDGQREDGLLSGFWQYGWRVDSRTATGVAVGVGLVAWLLRPDLHPGIEGGIWAACALVPLTALLVFTGSTLQGFRRVPQAQLPQLLLRPALFGVGIVLVGSRLGAGGAVALNAAATAVALGVSLVLLRRAVPATALATSPAFETSKWMGAIRSFLVISGAQLILSTQADILVVGTLLSPRDAGLYSAASQLSSLTMLGAQAVIVVGIPIDDDGARSGGQSYGRRHGTLEPRAHIRVDPRLRRGRGRGGHGGSGVHPGRAAVLVRPAPRGSGGAPLHSHEPTRCGERVTIDSARSAAASALRVE